MEKINVEMDRKAAHALLSILSDSRTPGAKYFYDKVQEQLNNLWNPDHDQEAKCECGHRYYRHFDTYDDMQLVGCKYCECYEFEGQK